MTEDIKSALEVLKKGGIILYPTDTIWGIGCDATNSDAVKKIYEIKKREDSKSMLILLDSESRLQQYIKEVPEIAWQLLEVADEPMTIIYPGAKNIADNLIAQDGSIGIRITKEEFTNSLLYRFKKPIVSTSANISGQKSPFFFDEISSEIKNSVDYIVKYRQSDRTKTRASSIIKLGLKNEIEIIRK
jgi:L-threonylcarbamoyladenylate synthase